MTDNKQLYLFAPKVETLPTFTFDNVYVTENVVVYMGSNLPTSKSSRNTLTINGNLHARKNIAIVPMDFTDFGPNDLYFNGNVYVAGDAVAELFEVLTQPK